MKLPPQNIEAEESLLSYCMLYDPTDAMDILVPEDFYKPAHNKIFKAIAELHKRKEIIDIVTIKTELEKGKCLDEIGGATYLSKVMDCPICLNLVHYSKMIKAASVGRNLIEASINTANSIYDETITQHNIVDILDKAQSDIMKIGFDSGDKDTISAADLCLKRVGEYEELCKGAEPGIKTGFHSLDALTGGLFGAILVIIAARPGVGKTSFALNMAKNMASNRHKIGFFSLEMSKERLLDRLISGYTGINSLRLKSGRLGKDDWISVNEAAAKLYNLPLIFNDAGGLSVQELKSLIRKMVRQGVEVVFIDQLSKIRGGDGFKEHEKKASIVNELDMFKKEVRIPIVLLSQINREGDDKPILKNLARTGALEEDGDIILIGHREWLYNKKADETKAVWDLAKNRDGATRDIPMKWDGKTTTFYEETKTYDDYQSRG